MDNRRHEVSIPTAGAGFESDTAGERTRKHHILLLVNSLYFLLEYAFIMIGEKSYRLVGIHHNRLVLDKCYKTIRGAKISFSRLFRPRNWQKKMKPLWSRIYPPDVDWMEEKLQLIDDSYKD
jgi:hypothetical protein